MNPNIYRYINPSWLINILRNVQMIYLFIEEF